MHDLLLKKFQNPKLIMKDLPSADLSGTDTDMATRQQVSCVKKKHGFAPHEKITHIGGMFFGMRWTLSQEEAIMSIELGIRKFYMMKHGQVFNIVICYSDGNKYLKAEPDGQEPEILLSLNECLDKNP
jgi:hypothetical protein